MRRGMISKVAASAILTGVFVLSGCGKKSSPPPAVSTYGVSGNASYISEIFSGEVKAYDENNKEIGSATVNESGEYSISELSSKPVYVKLVTGAIGKGSDEVANSEDDNRVTVELSSDVKESRANISLSSYLNREYNTNLPSELKLSQKYYILNMQDVLVEMGRGYTSSFGYAAKALDKSISESSYSVLSKGSITENLKSDKNLMSLSTSNEEEIIERISDMLLDLTSQIESNEQKEVALNTLKIVMASIKEVVSKSLTDDDVAAIRTIVDRDTVDAVKSWVEANSDKDVNFYAQGVNIAKAVLIDPTTAPISADTPAIVAVTCENIDMSGPAKVACGPQEDNFKFAADFGELGEDDNLKETPDGGILLYQVSSDLGDVIPEFAQSGKGKNRIKHVWVEKKYIRLNSAALTLDTDAKFDLIKESLSNLYSIKGEIFEDNTNALLLEEGDERVFIATIVLHFTNDQAEFTPNKEYLTATIEVVITRDGDKLKFTTPANSDILLTAKKLDQSSGVMVVAKNGDVDDASLGGEFSFDIQKYIDRLIVAGDKIGASNIAKEILVKNSTQKGPVKIYFSMSEKIEDGVFDRSFIRNPGLLNPADFALNVGGVTNPYLNAFNNGALQAIKFKLILE